MAIEFDPYKRPPAARLLAILVTGVLLAWLASGGQHSQADLIRRDPQKYYKHLAEISHRSPMVNVVVGVIVVTIIVFLVDGLTSLFGRWLKERQAAPDAVASGSETGVAPPSPNSPTLRRPGEGA